MKNLLNAIAASTFLFLWSIVSLANDAVATPDALVKRINNSSLSVQPLGVTASGTSIEALVHTDDFDLSTAKTRVLLVGDSSEASGIILAALEWFYSADEAEAMRSRFVLSAVPQVHPGAAKVESIEYPPRGPYYSAPDPAPAYVWRWIGMHAPDLIVEVRPAAERKWFVPKADDLQGHVQADWLQPAIDGSFPLADALVRNAASETGRISAIGVETAEDAGALFLSELLESLQEHSFRSPSPARQELQRRAGQTPTEIAEQLSRVYGHRLNAVEYIPALALVGRLRLGELTGDKSQAADVENIVKPYFDGAKPTAPDNGSVLSGHLIFSELSQRAVQDEFRRRYLELARNAADLGFTESGQLKPSMPFHSEMSDALFMGGPILAHVGKLTGDPRYYEMCLRHLQFMRRLVLRPDGLYRHSPLDEAAWGRGNGFPALGVALCLQHWPADREDRAELLSMFQSHMKTLIDYQDKSGCWHQVIDRPDSYREFTCTCMITFAAALGVREGWLPRAEYDPLIRQGWDAIRLRIGPDGHLVDVCTGTGKQKSLTDYYHRTAILGRDDRGGAMALMAATEMAVYLKN